MAIRTNKAKWYADRNQWRITVQRNGSRKDFTSSIKGRKGKQIAEEKADNWLTGEQPNKSTVRLQAVWDSFIEDKRITTGAANVNKLVTTATNWILPRLAKRKLSAITDQDWQNCINETARQNKSKRTAEHVRSTIIALCKHARKARQLTDLPIDLTIPKNMSIGNRTILQPSDLKTLFTTDTDEFFIHAFRFIVVTGLRRGECLAIQPRTDLNGSILTIQRSLNSLGQITKGKTKNAHRTLLLPSIAMRIIADQLALLKSHGIVSPYLFPDTDGTIVDPNKVYKHWLKWRDAHNLAPCNLHELRHTMISLSKSQIPKELLKLFVGHSKEMDTFGVYGHEVDGEKQLVADTLDKIFADLV